MRLVVLPSSDGHPTPEGVCEVLRNGVPFLFRNALHEANISNLRYYDSISEQETHFCMIHLLRVDDTSPILIGDIVRLKNMPVAPLTHLVIDHLRTMLAHLEQPGNSHQQVITLNNLLLAAKERNLTASSNTLFNQEANSVLGRALHLWPQLSHVLLTATPLFPSIPPAGSIGPTSPTNLLDNERSNLAFVDSLAEIDSDQEDDVQVHGNPGPLVDSRVQTICRITKKVVRLLRDRKIDCALFGSAACWLYGNTRVPDVCTLFHSYFQLNLILQDIDLVAFPPPELSREPLKDIIQQGHPRLHLERPANPSAPFKILFFYLDGINGPRGFFPGNKCKIDILIPGILHLPHLSGSQIPQLGGLPVVPFSVLLLQKLQGWDDHRKMRWSEPKKFAKSSIDARDLQELLTLQQHIVPLRVSQPWNDTSLFTEEFMSLSRQRVRDFCDHFPACKHDFELLGLFLLV